MGDFFRELFSKGPGSLELILFGLYLGAVIGCAAALYDRRTLGNYVRALIAAGALDRENAKTLAELGYEKSIPVKRALRGKSVFAGTVFEASEEPVYDREDHALPVFREGYDVKSARFYIPAPLKYRAEVRFEKKGSHIMALVLGAILFAVLILVILVFKDRVIAAVRDWLDV